MVESSCVTANVASRTSPNQNGARPRVSLGTTGSSTSPTRRAGPT